MRVSKDSRLVGNSFFGGWATMMFAGGGRVDQIKIGKFIASLRRGRGWTQQQLADQLGITNKTVSRWENARYLPDVEMLQLLAELFEVSVAELLAGEVSNTKKAVRNRSEAFDELKEQTFTTPERRAYWKRKWLQEHCVSLGLEVASLLSGFVAGRLLSKPMLSVLALIGLFLLLVWQRNRMFGYLEGKLYACAKLEQ